MTQYIDKDELVEKINKLLNDEFQCSSYDEATGFQRGLDLIKSFLGTLEVKEVDLEKEIDEFYGVYRKDGQTFSLGDNEECVDWKVDCNPEFEKYFAKYFFELGLKAAQKK